MATHEAFAEAGANPGIEIWTIEQFEPVAIPSKSYGKFYNGDSYIVLKTSGQSNATLSYDAHFWLGSKTTQDKKGSAAIWTVTLDDMLGGKAVHHREVQGHESSRFLGYFKPAIRYMEGGNESGFTEVETNAGAEKRLLKLSGCENMRIEEVPSESSSLTKDHCFILEVDHDIFVLMPEGAKATQRRKIISVANQLRDDNHNGRATIEIIDEFSSDEDYDQFFQALGSGSKDEIASDDSGTTYYRDDISAVYLYRVMLGDGFDVVALNKPYKQSHLTSDEVFILDTPCSGVYIWIGSEVSADVRKAYHDIANQYFEAKNYPSWVNVTKVAEGSECSTFKQYFVSWNTVITRSMGAVSDDAGYDSDDAEQNQKVAQYIGKSAAAREYMPDNGEGSLTVTRVGDGADVTEDFTSGCGMLYQSEVYVVKYQYTEEDGEDNYIVYYWIGSKASADDKQAGAELVAQLEDELGDDAAVVKVPQGKEPRHFLIIFKGNLAIVFGGKDTDYKPTNAEGNYDENSTRLFRVEGTDLSDMRAVQVGETADNLEDDDVYVLELADIVYVWIGNESNEKEKAAVKTFVKMLVGEEKEISTVEQGSEPPEFWDALGGEPEEKSGSGWRNAVNRRVTAPRTLTAVNVSITKKITFEDLDTEFTQQDLSDDGVYILDTGEELYLWQGKKIPERVKMARNDIIKEYIEDDGLDRTVDNALVVFVKQGEEPGAFRKLFPEWDTAMWDNQTSYEDIKNETKAANSK
ncbi:gelsolin, cytoplasmic-like [Spodoptera frugiperda]|uniref:Gelsolin, cytoplasmic-like n=1 Tax=Spodoptera frugiperda TaxID=7108 RepID=A0A9R0E008_SPOFR|nr:gelsolin, cytoplasmic-like [Spodoptera frugiperda]